MKCPKCDGLTHVLMSRFRSGKHTTNRRRECLQCGHRFTTIELIVPSKRNIHPEDLLRGLELADKE
jgi:transcriptional regulator NrdR family protein